jgi:serine/threonine-protein kinase
MVELARALEGALAELAAGGDEQDLGAYVRSVLADKVERRRAAIKESLRLADEQTERRKSLPFPAASQPTWGGTNPGFSPGSTPGFGPGSTPGSTPPTTGVTNVTTVLGSLSQSQPGFPAPRLSDPSGTALPPVHAPSGSKRTLLAAAALVAVGIGVGALLFARRGGDPVVANHTVSALPAEPTAAAVVTAAPSGAPSGAAAASASAEPAASASSSAKPLAGGPQAAARPRLPGPAPTAKPTSKPTSTGPYVPQIRNPGF